MTLLGLIILIILAGVLLWGVNVYIPMASMIKGLLNFLVFVILLVYVLQFFGLITMVLPFPAMFNK
jgi:small-conductance mechanosensitive channel